MTMGTDHPTWWESVHGEIICGQCRLGALRNWNEQRVAEKGGNEDEVVRKSDFTNLGKTPWKGEEPGYRYMQCDNCLGQWGPDA